MQLDSNFTIARRPVIHNGQPRMCQGMTADSLIRMLKECDKDAVVMFAVALPSGKTIWAGVQGAITDYDGTGACCALLDANVVDLIRNG